MSGLKRHFVRMMVLALACFCGNPAGAQISTDGTVTITLAVAPPDDTVIMGDEQISIEAFVTATASPENGGPIMMKGGQIGFFCNITSGTTVLQVDLTNPSAISAGSSSANGTPPLCPGGLAPTHLCCTCFAARSPLPLGPPCPTVDGVPLYLATITYNVSDCATDPVEVHAEPLGVADGAPAATDETRFRDDGPGSGMNIPIVAEVFPTLIPVPPTPSGACCDGATCLAESVGPSCCASTFPGSTFVAGATCAGGIYGDIYPPGGSGVRDIDDLICMIQEFAVPGDCPQSDMYPCGGDGATDIDDLVAMLESFNYNFLCPTGCP